MRFDDGRSIISIEYVDGVKFIRYIGYVYDCGELSYKLYRLVKYEWLAAPIDEVLVYGVYEYERIYRHYTHQYINDLPTSAIYNLERYKAIVAKNITADTPCGLYYY